MTKEKRKSRHLGKLQELHRKYFFKKHPTVPEIAYPARKFSQKDANSLTKSIVEFITFRGGVAYRINNQGTWDAKRKVRRKGVTRKGVPDIDATFEGRAIKIEVKVGKDRMSDAQIKLKDQLEAAGALYFIAKDFDSFYEWFCEIFGEGDL
jgi:hypothetical protein